MGRRGLLATFAALAIVSLGVSCSDEAPPQRGEPFAYDRSRPLRPVVETVAREGGLAVKRVTYTAADGERVPALFAVPQDTELKGCLIYQGGLGSRKERAATFWQGAAELGLATFTIDTRHTGERATKTKPLTRVVRDPDSFVAMIRGGVLDLRRAVDLLERRPACRRNIGYLGTSLGASLGAVVAGADPRIHAAVLTSIGATWRERLLYSGDLVLPGIADRPRRLRRTLRMLRPFETVRWVARISPRPVMLVNGRQDPRVPIVDGLNLAAGARDPKTVFFHGGGHDPFGSPHGKNVASRIGAFLLTELAEFRSG